MTVVMNGKSGSAAISPTDAMYSIVTAQVKNHETINITAIGGTKNTYGVPPINKAVHFITETPILMFLQLHKVIRRINAARPPTPYDP